MALQFTFRLSQLIPEQLLFSQLRECRTSLRLLRRDHDREALVDELLYVTSAITEERFEVQPGIVMTTKLSVAFRLQDKARSKDGCSAVLKCVNHLMVNGCGDGILFYNDWPVLMFHAGKLWLNSEPKADAWWTESLLRLIVSSYEFRDLRALVGRGSG